MLGSTSWVRSALPGLVVASLVSVAWAPSGCSESDANGSSSGEPDSGLAGVDAGACERPSDCASGACRDGTCATVAPASGAKDGDETDVDCGGAKAPACADGKACAIAADCTSVVCTGGTCQVPTATDGVKNGTETGTDCGGASGKKCVTGQGCTQDADCALVKCDVAARACAGPSGTDGIKNGNETDVDCGGTADAKCLTGKTCLVSADCAGNVLCEGATAKTCSAPRKNDGLKNGNETDVDCGSTGAGTDTGAPKCGVGLGCAMPVDCASDGCTYDGKCADRPSCAPLAGGQTCGKGEVDDANRVHESCCATAPLPSNPAVKVGKYEITAGRMREFIRRTGGNVRGWVDANRAKTAQIPDQLLKYLPDSQTGPQANIKVCTQWTLDGNGNPKDPCLASETISRGFGVRDHLGNNVFMQGRPCIQCGQGCFVDTKNGAFGHPTFWWDKASQEFWGASERDFDQSTLDAKSLNCTVQFLLAAFCAWDGGRLPTQPELGGANGAWGAGAYPWTAQNNVTYKDTWSATDALRQQYTAYDNNGNAVGIIDANAWFVRMIDDNANVRRDAPARNTANWNPFGWSVPELRYAFPRRPFATWDRADQAFAIAAPGRMVNDRRVTGVGALDGYFDVSGNLIEVTATDTGPDNDVNHRDADGNVFRTFSWVGGSFEGHGAENRGGYNLNVFTKYGKMGARCAYDN
jgi:hypothetical protein